MEFQYPTTHLTGREHLRQRCFEMLPGLTSWGILLIFLTTSLLVPDVSCWLMILFFLYWAARLLHTTLFTVVGFLRLRIEQSLDWRIRLNNLNVSIPPATPLNHLQRIADWLHQRRKAHLQSSSNIRATPDNLFHLVLLPVLREDKQVLTQTLEGLKRADVDPDRLIVLFALEERAPDHIKDGVRALRGTYQNTFRDVLIVSHPDDIPSEKKVKGANTTFAARAAREYFQEQGIPPEQVLVSNFDADTVVSPQYFQCLAYHFLVTPDRTRASFQPILVYHNNFWEAPGFARVLDIFSSFFQLYEATDRRKLVSFSSHAMSLKAVVDSGYWPVDMISDDSAFYWQSLLRFEGHYRVIPMFVTVSAHIVTDPSWLRTWIQVYRQKRRWAWGVENFPRVMRGFRRLPAIPLTQKFRQGFQLFESSVSWATFGLLLPLLGWLPLILHSQNLVDPFLYRRSLFILGAILQVTSLSLWTFMLMSFFWLPPHPRWSIVRPALRHLFDWCYLPVVGLFLSAMPALDAQTRLMTGRYLTGWPDERRRLSETMP